MNDPLLEYKFVQIIGDTLQGFKKVRENVYNFRCPICGDSHKSSKKRGYFIRKEGNFIFYCHNCGTSLSFPKFLQQVDVSIYKQFQREKLSSGIKLKFNNDNTLSLFKDVKRLEIKESNIVPVSNLPKNHKAYVYLKGRNIPEEYFERVKWTDDFPKLVKDSIGEKYSGSKLPKSGIIFELKDTNKKITGYQIRSIEENVPKSQRFVICSINEEHDYYFDSLDTSKDIYVVEGCIDSLFIDNCVAVLSSTLWKFHPYNNCIYFNDQEPRNKSVCKQIEKCINLGYNVVLLPHEYEGMDINDIVNSGVSIHDLKPLLKKHTYSGISAKMRYSGWKK